MQSFQSARRVHMPLNTGASENVSGYGRAYQHGSDWMDGTVVCDLGLFLFLPFFSFRMQVTIACFFRNINIFMCKCSNVSQNFQTDLKLKPSHQGEDWMGIGEQSNQCWLHIDLHEHRPPTSRWSCIREASIEPRCEK